jgi:hypothetical protein
MEDLKEKAEDLQTRRCQLEFTLAQERVTSFHNALQKAQQMSQAAANVRYHTTCIKTLKLIV